MRGYAVLWGPPSGRVHKAYTDDGFILINVQEATLYDEQYARKGRGSLQNVSEVGDGSAVTVGSFPVQVNEELDANTINEILRANGKPAVASTSMGALSMATLTQSRKSSASSSSSSTRPVHLAAGLHRSKSVQKPFKMPTINAPPSQLGQYSSGSRTVATQTMFDRDPNVENARPPGSPPGKGKKRAMAPSGSLVLGPEGGTENVVIPPKKKKPWDDDELEEDDKDDEVKVVTAPEPSPEFPVIVQPVQRTVKSIVAPKTALPSTGLKKVFSVPTFTNNRAESALPMPSTSKGSGETGSSYWLVTYNDTITTQKKHKGYEKDGLLKLDYGKQHATLWESRADGTFRPKPVLEKSYKGGKPAVLDVRVIGSYEIEIQLVLDKAEAKERICEQDENEVEEVSSTLKVPGVLASSFKKHDVDPTIAKGLVAAASQIKPPPKSLYDSRTPGAILLRRPDEYHQEVFNSKPGRPPYEVVDVLVDPLIGAKLRPHQVEGVRFLYECVMGLPHKDGEEAAMTATQTQGCILADEMGVGKTIQSIALLWTLLRQNPYVTGKPAVERACIVCPVGLVANWRKEIKKWLGPDRLSVFAVDEHNKVKTFCVSKNYKVLIIGYEKLRKEIELVKHCQPPIGLLICDEGHRLKSAKSQTAQALATLSCQKRIVLSGTPIQNNLGEFHACVDFVNPGILDNYPAFKRVYETTIAKGREPGATRKQRELGQERHLQLTTVVSNFLLQRSASVNASFLPPRYDYVVFVTPTAVQLDLYATITSTRGARDVMSGEGGHDGLSLLSVLQKLCTSPGLLAAGHEQGKHEGILTSKVVAKLPQASQAFSFDLSGKLRALASMLEALYRVGEEKIIVVSNFTSTLDLVQLHLEQKKYSWTRMDGTTIVTERQRIVDTFNGSNPHHCFVFLLSSKSGGTGFNLIGASRLILLDSDWNPANDAQVMARIHREGQKKPCYVYRFLTAGTIDEKIFQRQMTKLSLSGSLMDNLGGAGAAAGSSKKSKNAFTKEELRTVFRLEKDTLSHTHDVLGCRCHIESAEQMDLDGSSTDDDSDDDAAPAWGTAAAIAPAPKKELAKARHRLAALKEYQHFDCTADGLADTLEDTILVYAAFETQKTAERRPVAVRESNSDSSDSDEEDMLEEDPSAILPGVVSFAFMKKSNSDSDIKRVAEGSVDGDGDDE